MPVAYKQRTEDRHPPLKALATQQHGVVSTRQLKAKLEKRFRVLLRTSSLPLPAHNVNVGPYELDCYWPERGFCVELDTYGTHGSRRSFEADRKRERELRRLGVEVERVTDRQLEDEPDEVLAAVAENLERCRPRAVN
jgi:very-short-patch-repair endonuclease